MAAAPTSWQAHQRRPRRALARFFALALTLALLATAAPTSVAAQENPVPEPPAEEPAFDLPWWMFEQAERNIVGGTPVSIEDYPWQVQIVETLLGFGQYCGGTLVAPQVVVTAAHCVDGAVIPSEYAAVVAGTTTRNDATTGQWSSIHSVLVHPSWVPPVDEGTRGSGIDQAVIFLDQPFTLNAQVSTLPIASAAEAAGNNNRRAQTTGWGPITLAVDALPPEQLHTGRGTIKTNANACSNRGINIDTSHEFCVDGSTYGQTPCVGDSGGPVAVEFGNVWKLVGVTSWTLACETEIFAASDTAADWLWLSLAIATPPLPSTTSISGRLFFDTDRNGTEDFLEPGVPGIEVRLVRPGILGAPDTVVASAVTDALGYYSLNTAVTGTFFAEFTIPQGSGLAPTGVGGTTTDTDFTADGTVARTEPITVSNNLNFLFDVDAGLVERNEVSGVIFEDTNLDGIAGESEPDLAGTSSIVVTLANVDGSLVLVKNAVEGEYFFEDVPAGSYQLSVGSLPLGRVITRVGISDEEFKNAFSPFSGETELFTIEEDESAYLDLGLTPVGMNPFVDVANTNCDGVLSIVDALLIAQYAVGVRDAVATCPMTDVLNQIRAENADVNLNGRTDIVDALLVAQCAANLDTEFCNEPSGLADPNGGTQGSAFDGSGAAAGGDS